MEETGRKMKTVKMIGDQKTVFRQMRDQKRHRERNNLQSILMLEARNKNARRANRGKEWVEELCLCNRMLKSKENKKIKWIAGYP